MKTKCSLFLSAMFISSLIALEGSRHGSNIYTRGAGIYPGNPEEDFSPQLAEDNINYRNMARLKPAYQSLLLTFRTEQSLKNQVKTGF